MNLLTQRRVFCQERILINLLQSLHLATSSDLLFNVCLGWLKRWPVFLPSAVGSASAAAVWFDFENDGPFNDRDVTLILE